jgi:hypothetical protein
MRLSEYLGRMEDAIEREEECVEEEIEIEEHIKRITQHAYRQGSITKDEYDTIMKILSRKMDLLIGIGGLLDRLRDYLGDIRKARYGD